VEDRFGSHMTTIRGSGLKDTKQFELLEGGGPKRLDCSLMLQFVARTKCQILGDSIITNYESIELVIFRDIYNSRYLSLAV